MVDFPAPEGPLITMGWFAERASLGMAAVSAGAMVEAWQVNVREGRLLKALWRYAARGVERAEHVTRAMQLRESSSRLLDTRERVNGMPIVGCDDAGC